MKDLAEFRADLEESLNWRLEEYFCLKNLIRDDDVIPTIKTLIVMLYAHFEGFFKDALEVFVNFINSIQEKRNFFIPALIAASLNREYAAFENMNRKCKLLSTVPPAESTLHRYHRRIELSHIFSSNYMTDTLRIEEKIINTQSNLNYEVLQENMYILGLDYSMFQDRISIINRLVSLRNSVAHGAQRNPISIEELEVLEGNTLAIMNTLITYLYTFCFDGKYKK